MAMALVKTQVYLTRRQHRELRRGARRLGISLAELVRKLAEGYLDGPVPKRPTPRAIQGLVKLGRSGVAGTSRGHHAALDELLRSAPVR